MRGKNSRLFRKFQVRIPLFAAYRFTETPAALTVAGGVRGLSVSIRGVKLSTYLSWPDIWLRLRDRCALTTFRWVMCALTQSVGTGRS
jgi:hypothetical protein